MLERNYHDSNSTYFIIGILGVDDDDGLSGDAVRQYPDLGFLTINPQDTVRGSARNSGINK